MRALTTIIMSGVAAIGLIYTAWAAEPQEGAQEAPVEGLFEAESFVSEPQGAEVIEALPIADVQPLHRAVDLNKMSVVNPQGEELGRIKDIVLSDDRRSVDYLAVSSGEQFHAIPLDDFRVTTDGETLVYDATREDLDAREGFTKEAWPDTAARAGLRERLAELLGLGETEEPVAGVSHDPEQPADPGDMATFDDTRRVSELIGYPVRDAADERVGTIRDLLIDAKNGAITEASIGIGGFLGIREQYASVDWAQVRIDAEQQTAIIDLSADQVREVAVEVSEYWESLGFVEAEKREEPEALEPDIDQELEQEHDREPVL